MVRTVWPMMVVLWSDGFAHASRTNLVMAAHWFSTLAARTLPRSLSK